MSRSEDREVRRRLAAQQATCREQIQEALMAGKPLPAGALLELQRLKRAADSLPPGRPWRRIALGAAVTAAALLGAFVRVDPKILMDVTVEAAAFRRGGDDATRSPSCRSEGWNGRGLLVSSAVRDLQSIRGVATAGTDLEGKEEAGGYYAASAHLVRVVPPEQGPMRLGLESAGKSDTGFTVGFEACADRRCHLLVEEDAREKFIAPRAEEGFEVTGIAKRPAQDLVVLPMCFEALELWRATLAASGDRFKTPTVLSGTVHYTEFGEKRRALPAGALVELSFAGRGILTSLRSVDQGLAMTLRGQASAVTIDGEDARPRLVEYLVHREKEVGVAAGMLWLLGIAGTFSGLFAGKKP